jgi:hypothetical protein
MGVVISNQELQIPVVKHIVDPALFPGDPFVATLGHFASALWPVVALPARWVSIEPLLVVLFLIERALVMYAFGRLASAIAKGSRTALIGGWLFAALNPQPFLGAGTIVAPYFEQTGVAIALLALAGALLLEGRALAFAVCLGLALDVNILYGIFGLSYFCPVFMLSPSHRSQVRRWGKALAGALVIGVPAFTMVLAAKRADGSFSQTTWVGALRAYFPDHFFPDTWDKRDIARFALFMAGAVAAAVMVRRRRPVLARLLMGWSAVALGWIALSAVNAYAVMSPGLFTLQPARGIDAGLVLISCAVMALAAADLDVAKEGPARWRAACAFAMMPMLFLDGVKLVFLWAIALFMAELLRKFGVRSGWDRRVKVMSWPLAATLALSMAICYVGAMGYRRHREVVRRPNPAVREIADWARRNTPVAASFLVDSRWGEWRSLAERTAFVTWKEGAAFLWQKDFVNVWVERLAALGWNFHRGEPSREVTTDAITGTLTAETVKQIANRYRLDYWVVPRDRRLALPVVFEGRLFKVLAVDH